MHAVIVKAVPTIALGAFAVALQVKLAAALVEGIVLTWHIPHRRRQSFEDLVSRVEFLRLREMGDIAGMQNERRLAREGVDLIDSELQRLDRLRIRVFVKADMTVANLHEVEGRIKRAG